MISTGTTAITTSSDTAVSVFTKIAEHTTSVNIINEGSVAGFFTVDGNPPCRLPAGSTATIKKDLYGSTITVQRAAGGSNLSGIYAWGE